MLAALLMTASMAVGQAELKDLEYFVGTWNIEGEMKVEGEFEGLDEVTGKPLRMQSTYEWFHNKAFMLVTIRENPQAAPSYVAVIGWDPERKQIRSWDFNAQGARLRYVHIKKDGGWVLEGPSVYPGGAEGVYRGEIKIIDQQTFRTEGKGTMKQDGKESQVSLVYEAKRQ